MTATQFIDTPKIHLKPIKTLAKNQDIQESHKLNYSIISFLNREVVDNLTLFVEQGIISNKDISFFTSRLDSDSDYFFGMGKKHNQENDMVSDFFRVQNLFLSLGEKSLSNYKKTNAPILIDLATSFFQLQFIIKVTPLLLASIGRVSDRNMMRIVKEKSEELKDAFMLVFVNYSNKKEFNFNQYDSLFEKIRHMNYNDFVQLIDKDLK